MMTHPRRRTIGIALLAIAALFAARPAQAEVNQNAEQDAAHTRVLTDRAEKIVGPLGIDDSTKKSRVRDLIVNQYRRLGEIHDARDARIAEAKKTPGDPTLADSWTKVARDRASLDLIELHHHFVSRLAVELTPEQLEQVKDGMTYGVVQVTYKRYLELLPDLTAEQKREILANLIEAREYAMDGGSSEEKHAIFGKYKGRINNYLSAAGYDLKRAEQDLATRKQPASSTTR